MREPSYLAGCPFRSTASGKALLHHWAVERCFANGVLTSPEAVLLKGGMCNNYALSAPRPVSSLLTLCVCPFHVLFILMLFSCSPIALAENSAS